MTIAKRIVLWLAKKNDYVRFIADRALAEEKAMKRDSEERKRAILEREAQNG